MPIKENIKQAFRRFSPDRKSSSTRNDKKKEKMSSAGSQTSDSTSETASDMPNDAQGGNNECANKDSFSKTGAKSKTGRSNSGKGNVPNVDDLLFFDPLNNTGRSLSQTAPQNKDQYTCTRDLTGDLIILPANIISSAQDSLSAAASTSGRSRREKQENSVRDSSAGRKSNNGISSASAEGTLRDTLNDLQLSNAGLNTEIPISARGTSKLCNKPCCAEPHLLEHQHKEREALRQFENDANAPVFMPIIDNMTAFQQHLENLTQANLYAAEGNQDKFNECMERIRSYRRPTLHDMLTCKKEVELAQTQSRHCDGPRVYYRNEILDLVDEAIEGRNAKSALKDHVIVAPPSEDSYGLDPTISDCNQTRLNFVKTAFKRFNKFGDKSDVEIIPLMRWLTEQQELVKLSEREFKNQILEHFRGSALNTINGWIVRNNLSVTELYQRIIQHFYTGLTPEESRQVLQEIRSYQFKSLADAEDQIEKLAAGASYEKMIGYDRDYEFRTLSTRAMKEILPERIKTDLATDIDRFRGRHQRELEFDELVKLLSVHRRDLDQFFRNKKGKIIPTQSKNSGGVFSTGQYNNKRSNFTSKVSGDRGENNNQKNNNKTESTSNNEQHSQSSRGNFRGRPGNRNQGPNRNFNSNRNNDSSGNSGNGRRNQTSQVSRGKPMKFQGADSYGSGVNKTQANSYNNPEEYNNESFNSGPAHPEPEAHAPNNYSNVITNGVSRNSYGNNHYRGNHRGQRGGYHGGHGNRNENGFYKLGSFACQLCNYSKTHNSIHCPWFPPGERNPSQGKCEKCPWNSHHLGKICPVTEQESLYPMYGELTDNFNAKIRALQSMQSKNTY